MARRINAYKVYTDALSEYPHAKIEVNRDGMNLMHALEMLNQPITALRNYLVNEVSYHTNEANEVTLIGIHCA